MPRIAGHLGASGCPTIRVRVEGSATSLDFDAVVDTGFSGFIVLPILLALPIGLTLTGTVSSNLADGSEALQYTAEVKVDFGTESHVDMAILPYDEEVLVGMRFLDFFRKSLLIHRGQVILIDQADLDSTLPAELLH